MQIKIRLYKVHDYDLCKLYLTKGFNFPKYMKEALIGYSKGERILIQSPLEISKKEIPTRIEIKISLNEDIHKDTIKLLRKIKKRQQNSFLKSLFRQSLDGNILSDYFQLDANDEKIVLNDKDNEDFKEIVKVKKIISNKNQPAMKKENKAIEKSEIKEDVKSEIKEEELIKEATDISQEAAENVFDMFNNLIENY